MRDYKREEARRLSREIALEEWLLKGHWETLAWMDESVFNSIQLKNDLDLEVNIQDEDLYDQLISLSEEERQILLLSYFFDFTDEEIGRLLKKPRRTVSYQRCRILEILKAGKERGNKKMRMDVYWSEKIPEQVIRLAVQGDEVAINRILSHYDGYMEELASRTRQDERGMRYSVPDPYLKRLLETQLITAILKFRFK